MLNTVYISTITDQKLKKNTKRMLEIYITESNNCFNSVAWVKKITKAKK